MDYFFYIPQRLRFKTGGWAIFTMSQLCIKTIYLEASLVCKRMTYSLRLNRLLHHASQNDTTKNLD